MNVLIVDDQSNKLSEVCKIIPFGKVPIFLVCYKELSHIR